MTVEESIVVALERMGATYSSGTENGTRAWHLPFSSGMVLSIFPGPLAAVVICSVGPMPKKESNATWPTELLQVNASLSIGCVVISNELIGVRAAVPNSQITESALSLAIADVLHGVTLARKIVA